MKILGLTLCLIFITTFAFADVTAKVLTIEKELRKGDSCIKVISEFTYPDGTKHLGITYYSYDNFSKEAVFADLKQHCKTITKYYLENNLESIQQKKEQLIDNIIISQQTLPSADKVTSLTYSLKDVYLPDLNLTVKAEGKTKELYK